MTTKSFESWTYEEVENTFGLVRVANHAILSEWLDVINVTIEPHEANNLQALQKLLRANIDDWNEQELEICFIGPLFLLIDFFNPHYKPFFGRSLSAKLGSITASGVADFMLASGRQKPRQPYFCLHEYKRARGRDNDPLGQLLIAMLCAQAKNNKVEQPIYGLFVEGRFWYFVILAGKEYAVTEPFVATRDDLETIFKLLRHLKELIERWL